MNPLLYRLAVLLALTTNVAGATTSPQVSVQNLRAFARLYGYVRFFHPSDEAAGIDWDRFAIYGADQVRLCESEESLDSTLRGLFGPLAPTVQIYDAKDKPESVKLPSDTSGLVSVCWRHKGWGRPEAVYSYRSSRFNRSSPQEILRRQVIQYAAPPAHAARQVRLRLWARTAGQDPRQLPELWLAVARKSDPSSGSINLAAVPVQSPTWRMYEATAPLPAATIYGLTFGALTGRTGSLWLDDVELAVEQEPGRWENLDIGDPGFEDTLGIAHSRSWGYSLKDLDAARVSENPHSGSRCLWVAPDSSAFFYRAHLRPGEFVDKALDRHLMCRVPLCLYSDGHHTLPRADSTAWTRLAGEVSAVRFDSLSGRRLDVRLGDVTIAWSILQHFYPYFDVVKVDWDTTLTSALNHALSDTSVTDFLYTLQRMTVALQDGHASGTAYLPEEPLKRTLPCKVEMVEGRVTVVASRDTSRFRRGDVILAINGTRAEKALAAQRERVSGSPQFRQAIALRRMLLGRRDQTARVRLWRGADTLDVESLYSRAGRVFADQGDSVRQVEPGIWYVDLDRVTTPDVNAVMERLSTARGVIFDARGYINVGFDLISHLLSRSDTSQAWMRIPEFVFPDREKIAGWEKWNLGLIPIKPRIEGRVVFLINGDDISSAEGFLSYVENYKLGETVGQTTAGTTGNINPIFLPGRYRYSWTGMLVLKQDGSQNHLIGIRPTVPLERTLNALREGRDEYIEKAVELIRS